MGIVMNPKKIRRLMHKFNLFCPIRKANPYRRMAKALRTNNVADNLLNREFESHGPRMVLLTDITYIGFQDGFLYLSTILDAYTKEALAHVLSNSMEIDFVLETVKNMQRDYGVSLKAETMIHSDQGPHYTSVQFIQIVSDLGLRQSMSRRGNCWDNAPQESFYGHMKDELADKMEHWDTFEDVKRDIDDWFDYYNHDRYQWQLAKLSPSQFLPGSTRFPAIHPWEEFQGALPLDPGIYRMFLGGSPPVSLLSACNRKERYRMAPPPRKPAGAQVASLRCPILRLLASEVYHDW